VLLGQTIMVNLSNTQSEIMLRKDREWSLIDSELCLITDFLPILGSAVKDGIVTSSMTTEPYASISIECKRTEAQVTGFICHKGDFTHLWSAFRERGVDEQKEEVLIYWSTRHYKNRAVRLLSALTLSVLGATPLPKVVVMICPKGTYKNRADGFKWPQGQDALLFAAILVSGIKSPNCWIPEVMK